MNVSKIATLTNKDANKSRDAKNSRDCINNKTRTTTKAGTSATAGTSTLKHRKAEVMSNNSWETSNTKELREVINS
jgi:hypothetical protein